MTGAINPVQERGKCMMKTPSTRKPRNNKIHTARGPRDRRIRLSADIAIQFYDVQDRLGCERASEAVDWLISKAKGSIDKLIDTSFEQEFKHIINAGAQHSGYYLSEHDVSGISRSDYGISFHQGNCLPEIMSSRGADHTSGAACFSNNCYDESSKLLSYTQMCDNRLQDHQCLGENISLASLQQTDEKAQIPKMIMYNSELNPTQEHKLTPYHYVPFMPSSVHTPTSNPTLNLCLPGYNTSSLSLSDSERWTIF